MQSQGQKSRGKTIDESTLLAAYHRGSPEAFGALFDRFRDPVFRLAYRFTTSAADAEDLAEEVFVRLFERPQSFRGESGFSTYIYRLTVNACLNHCRRARPNTSLDELESEPLDLDADPATVFARAELGRDMQSAISDLPEGLRVVFLLVAVEDLTYAQVSEILGLSIEAVRMRMSRARGELRAQLADLRTGG